MKRRGFIESVALLVSGVYGARTARAAKAEGLPGWRTMSYSADGEILQSPTGDDHVVLLGEHFKAMTLSPPKRRDGHAMSIFNSGADYSTVTIAVESMANGGRCDVLTFTRGAKAILESRHGYWILVGSFSFDAPLTASIA